MPLIGSASVPKQSSVGGGVGGGARAEMAPVIESGTAAATSSSCGQERIVESVVYQLVRVECDGSLVPATDDEVVQVENMLQDCKNEFPESKCKSEQENFGIISEMTCHTAKEAPIKISPRNAAGSLALPAIADRLSEPSENAENASRTSDPDAASCSKPDFSLLNEEICLDGLTIRELQETFKATFGRETSVKDKLWLKRRIIMGLTNSCDARTNFILQGKNIFKKTVQKAHTQNEQKECRPVPCSVDHKKSLPRYGRQKGNQLFCGKTLSLSEFSGAVKNEEDANVEQSGGKRLRKPPKRYIEEHSELNTRDCSQGLVSSLESSFHVRSYPGSQKKQIQSNRDSSILVTRLDSLGGSIVQIPFVSRSRRRRPRKDFLTLVDFPATIRDKSVRESFYSSEQEPVMENANPVIAGCRSYNVTTSKGGTRRKYHRAWTLNEVMKLVEGVSRYGVGRWSNIKRLAFASYTYRTSVDLKDKWRNLLKASFSLGPLGKETRKHNNSPTVPTPILLRVRELAKMQRKPGIEFRAEKITSHAEKTIHEGGFL